MEYNLEEERKQILNAYRSLVRSISAQKSKEDLAMLRKAFDLAVDAHQDMRRKSGEPYIFHPIAVARICAEEMGLGVTSIICALLHDTVEDTEITLEDVERLFGKKFKDIVDGLTKINEVFDYTTSDQAENFRKLLISMTGDVRVILIKLADRLHNMRTLDSMRKDKQLKIASETSFLYAPLAHRLGFYNIKSELEDLALKYTDPETYSEILIKLEKEKEVRERFIRKFSAPIKKELEAQGFTFEIKGRTKSVYSIWNKITKKNVPFEEIYDLFAIRIIIESKPENEKADCWRVYSIVTDFYKPSPERLRDWISNPRQNGYESLHTTVMSPTGTWVEVQIRTTRMDEIAEKGFAAHWKYKEDSGRENIYDQWLNKVRELLDNKDLNALDFVDDFKLSLYNEEIFVFTPKGELKTLPLGSTALDFAFDIHTRIGETCIGAKVNHKLVPLSHPLNSGDQVEIITSEKQAPKEDWLNFVFTPKAKQRIKQSLRETKKRIASDGKEILERRLAKFKATITDENLKVLLKFYDYNDATELYYQIAKGRVDLKRIKEIADKNGKLKYTSVTGAIKQSFESLMNTFKTKKEDLILGDESTEFDYKLSPCCNPIPGDDVFGFLTINDGIKIHRTNCPNAEELRANYAYRIIKAKWKSQKIREFLATVRFEGIDDIGLVHNVTTIISQDLNVNMKSISFESNDGVFEGKITLYVTDTKHLNELIVKLKKVNGIKKIERTQ
jgi:GTP diphosphokinase / guanosine-3',5'-bis(diphosphate) 3'-diphosphatase